MVRQGKGFGACVVLDLRISSCDKGRGNGGEGLATCGNGRGVVGKTGLGVGLGQIGRVVRLGEGFDGGWYVGDIRTCGIIATTTRLVS